MNMINNNGTDVNEVHNKIKFISKFVFESPKLSLEFLFCYTPIATAATFMDLVLCYNYYAHNQSTAATFMDGRVYFITNPLTKQWVALPPCPVDKHPQNREIWAALICQSPYNHGQHYKFRVVEVFYPRRDDSLQSVDKFDLVVYCSEIGEWKEIKLRVSMEVGPEEPEIIVCNGIIYFKSGLCLVGLDPFDVNVACGATLEARVMPSLPDFGYLRESSGQLLVVHSPNSEGLSLLRYEEDGTTVELQIVMWKLDTNKAPLVWETSFQGLCKGTISIRSPYYPRSESCIKAKNIGVHP